MDAIATATLGPGKSFPLGASLVAGGANFSVFSKHASALQLLLFDGVNDDRPSKVINLDPRRQRTYHYWHALVPGLKAGQLYGYRAHGPYALEKGLRFDADKVLLNPYGKCIARPSCVSLTAARSPDDNAGTALKSASTMKPHGSTGPPWRGMRTFIASSNSLSPSGTRVFCRSIASR
jgi:glycogen operon protein